MARDSTPTGADSEIARLSRGRRRWAWIAGGCLAGAIAAFVIGNGQFPAGSVGNGLGAAVGVLLGMCLVVSALLCLYYNLSLRSVRAGGDARPASGAAERKTPAWAPWLAVVIAVGIGVFALPLPVGGIAYLAGAGQRATFTPVSYGQECSKGCYTVTNGFLTAGGRRIPDTWPERVPLDQPIQTRLAVWTWRSGPSLIGGPGNAIKNIFPGGFFSLAGIFALCLAAARGWQRFRKRAPAPTPPGST